MFPPSLLLLSMDGLFYRLLLIDYNHLNKELDELDEKENYLIEPEKLKVVKVQS